MDARYWKADDWPFSPEALEDRVVIGLPPARVVFPWDELELPAYDKEVLRLLSWHDGEFFCRWAKDWSSWSFEDWVSIRDMDKQRKRLTINKELESIKLDMVSMDEEARLDAYGYEVTYTEGLDTAE